MKISEVRARKAIRQAAEAEKYQAMSSDSRALHDQDMKSHKAHVAAKLQRQRLRRMAADSGQPVDEVLTDDQLAARAVGALLESEGVGMRGNPGESSEVVLTPEQRQAADEFTKQNYDMGYDDFELLQSAVKISNLSESDAKEIGDRWDG